MRVDTGFYIGTKIMGPTKVLTWDPCLFGLWTVAQVQLQQLRALTLLGSVLLWRILAVHIIEMRAHVKKHKQNLEKSFETPEVDAGSECGNSKTKNPKALLDRLQDRFKAYWVDHTEHRAVPTNFREVWWNVGRWGSLDNVLVTLSALAMGAGMIYLHLRLDPSELASEMREAFGLNWFAGMFGMEEVDIATSSVSGLPRLSSRCPLGL